MYCNWDPKKYKTPKKCQRDKTSVRHYGNSFLRPSIVKELQEKNTNKLTSIINYLIPMHCIFDRRYGVEADLPVRVFKYLSKNQEIKQMYHKEEAPLEHILLKNEPPLYVKQLFKTNSLKVVKEANEGNVENSNFDGINDTRLKRITIIEEL
jgi:hypothetical protein